jgi:hypothetical protein
MSQSLSRPYRRNGASKFRSAASFFNGGAAAGATVKRGMAASLNYSPMKGRCNMQPTASAKQAPQVTVDEALSLLQSAVSYCQSAGLPILAANGKEGLTLTIPGVCYFTNGKAAEFRIGNLAPSASEEGTLPAEAS